MQKNNLVQDNSDDGVDVELEQNQDVLLARLYDLCVALGKRVQILAIQTDEETPEDIIIITVKNTKYSEESGFEKTK